LVAPSLGAAAAQLFSGYGRPAQSDRKIQLLDRLASVHSRIDNDGLSILDAWREAVASNQCSYKYSRFASLYAHWRAEQGLQGRSRTRRRLVSLKSPDLPALKSWRLSHDRRKWEVGIALRIRAPWSGVVRWQKVNRPIVEWACAENNLGYEQSFELQEYPMPVANTPDF
jgi:hypothetical protein